MNIHISVEVNAYDLTRSRALRSCLYVPPREKTSDAYLPQISAKITSDLRAAGLNKERYAGHSFRRGVATFAMRCGDLF